VALPDGPKRARNAHILPVNPDSWAFERRARCLEACNERETPIFCLFFQISGRFEGRGAVSKPEMSAKRPDFASFFKFLGVLKDAALSRSRK
jgi:hypothetical protein